MILTLEQFTSACILYQQGTEMLLTLKLLLESTPKMIVHVINVCFKAFKERRLTLKVLHNHNKMNLCI